LEDLRTLQNGKWTPLVANSFAPVFYAEGKNLYVDVVLNDQTGVRLVHDELIGKPPQWDMNSDEAGMEVINEKHEVIFQLDFKTKTHIAVSGFFLSANWGVTVVTDSAISTLGPTDITIPDDIKMKNIFKYPSTRFPGLRAN